MGASFRQSIQDLLTALPTQNLEALKQLCWSELNHARANAPLPTRTWTDVRGKGKKIEMRDTSEADDTRSRNLNVELRRYVTLNLTIPSESP